MKILILGAGAIGSLFGAFLSRSGNEVTLVGRRAHIRAIQKRGLKLNDCADADASFTARPSAVTSLHSLANNFDMLIITVKAYDTAQACRIVRKHFGVSTPPILLLQNGLGMEDIARRILPKATLLRGVTYQASAIPSPGVVYHTGNGDTTLGSLRDHRGEACDSFVEAIRASGLRAKATQNIGGAVWSKTLVNAGGNPFGAITNMTNGELLRQKDLYSMMVATVREGEAVARKMNVRLDPEDPVHLLEVTGQATSMNKNSMLQDLEKGRRTEIDYINGAIARYGGKISLETPLNTLLTCLVKTLERKHRHDLKR